ncbi:hypothetical protein THAOC_02390 [Thalassiosira oceanica]|uniref:Hexose transporter 1 n=1 Tax=Thalassiosira oceanica TaxID=159749 RepID=K0TAT7_THAOC|nr:hypothetical protein THAOC_02390 [Thalassiosira oceanica]|eukprot:EJK75873.1 hypothetical protein THAOC_02390 [Thalassiosira oceanica]
MATPLYKLPNTLKASAVAVLGAVMFGCRKLAVDLVDSRDVDAVQQCDPALQILPKPIQELLVKIGYWAQTQNFVSFNRATTGSTDIVPTDTLLSALAVTPYAVATMFALPPVTRVFADGIGRRKTIIVAGVLFAIAMGLQALGANVPYPSSRGLLFGGRALLGIPIAFSVTTSPMFLSEIAPKAHRGLIGGLFQFTLMAVLVIAAGIGLAISRTYPDCDNCYQFSVWWMVPVGLLVSTSMYFSHETPAFLLLKGEDDEAERILFYLRKGGDDDETREEFQLMKEENEDAKKLGDATYGQLFSGFPLRIVLITSLMQALQQWSGQNMLNNFGPKLYVGVVSDPAMYAFLGNIVQFIGTIPSALIVDRVGRRPLLMGGAATLFIAWVFIAILGDTVIKHPDECLKVLVCPQTAESCDEDALFTSEEMGVESVCGDSTDYAQCSSEVSFTDADTFNLACLYTGDGAPTADNPYPHVSDAVGYTILVLTFVINFVFGFTLGPIVWSYNAEIAPVKFRALILGLAAASNLFWNGVIVYVPAMIIRSLGFDTFWMFAGFMAVAFLFFHWIVETKGLPLEIVTETWEKKLNCKYVDHHHNKDNGSTVDTRGGASPEKVAEVTAKTCEEEGANEQVAEA